VCFPGTKETDGRNPRKPEKEKNLNALSTRKHLVTGKPPGEVCAPTLGEALGQKMKKRIEKPSKEKKGQTHQESLRPSPTEFYKGRTGTSEDVGAFHSRERKKKNGLNLLKSSRVSIHYTRKDHHR